MKKYKQLNLDQRYTIKRMLEQGYTQKAISNAIGKSESTVSRELKRNVNMRGRGANQYDPVRAQKKTDKRHKEKPKHYRLEEWHLIYIRDKLINERWSPELISQRGKLEYGDFVSHETIYKYIWECKHSNKRHLRQDKDLHKYLRHHNRRQKRKNSKQNKGCIQNRTSIEKRPKVANERRRKGDYEVDLMMGSNHKPGLIVLTDRKTIETKLIKIGTKKSKVIARKIISKMQNEAIIHTLTFDNDLAFADHQSIAIREKEIN